MDYSKPPLFTRNREKLKICMPLSWSHAPSNPSALSCNRLLLDTTSILANVTTAHPWEVSCGALIPNNGVSHC